MNKNYFQNFTYGQLIHFLIKVEFNEYAVLRFIDLQKKFPNNEKAWFFFFKMEKYWTREFINRCLIFLSIDNMREFFSHFNFYVEKSKAGMQQIFKLYEIYQMEFNLSFSYFIYNMKYYITPFEKKIIDNGLIDFYLNKCISPYDLAMFGRGIIIALEYIQISDKTEREIIDLFAQEYYEQLLPNINNKSYLKTVYFINKIGVDVNG